MGSVSCRIYPKCHQILKVMMLVFYFFHHLWLTNRDGFDFVRGVCIWTLEKVRVGSHGELMGSISMIIPPLLTLGTNHTSL